YRSRLSGPLIDRIDLRLQVPRLTRKELLGVGAGEASAAVRARVEEARARQRVRYRGTAARCNGQLSGPASRREAGLDSGGEALLGRAVDRLLRTGRGGDRARPWARTTVDPGGRGRGSGR